MLATEREQALGSGYQVGRSRRVVERCAGRGCRQQTAVEDAAGNVESVQRTGVELAVNVHPDNEETPTLGNHRSLFQELFGNIGTVSQGGLPGSGGKTQ